MGNVPIINNLAIPIVVTVDLPNLLSLIWCIIILKSPLH